MLLRSASAKRGKSLDTERSKDGRFDGRRHDDYHDDDSFHIVEDAILCVETNVSQHAIEQNMSKTAEHTPAHGVRYIRQRNKEDDSTNGKIVVSSSQAEMSCRRFRLFTMIQAFVMEAFLPQGYPKSVSNDYLEYQMWDTAQAFCSYITGTLATQAVLQGVGVGNKEATAVGATVTYLMRDVTGMVGRILFAWAQGTDLDNNAKKWRLVADILNDIALFVDLLAPAFPAYFVVMICFSSLARAIVGVAGGATRAALTLHQARENNMGDVSAKDGSQETMVNLAAIMAGLVILPVVDNRPSLTWILFVTMTVCER